MSLWRLHVNIGKGGGNVVGRIEEPSGAEVSTFECSIEYLKDFGQMLRDAAREWAAAYTSGDRKAEASLWRKLHEIGARSFREVFGDDAGDVEDALRHAADDARIWVKQSIVETMFPWGLLCNPADLPLAGATPRPHLLWGSKYALTVALTETRSVSAHRKKPWSFAPVLCKPTYGDAADALEPVARTLAAAVKSRQLEPGDLHKRAALQNCLLYVYSHSDGKRLLFEQVDGEKKPYLPFEILRPLVSDGGTAVAVINACGSVQAVESLGAQLVLSAGRREVAVIATEVEVDRRFAMNFGLELIDRCLACGESTIDAMRAMVRKHYPLSIIYSHYTKNDHANVEPLSLFDACEAATAYRDWVAPRNHSDDFGCGRRA